MTEQDTLFRGATILAMDEAHGTSTFVADLLVTEGRIATIGAGLEAPAGARVIDAVGKLLMPGLVNAHMHSSEMLLRGRYERMPLEIWLLYAYPFLMDDPIGLRLLFLRSQLLAIESIRAGVTTVCDDFFDPPRHDLERLATVFRAYGEAGLRANVSAGTMNVPPLDAVPGGHELFPEHLKARLDFGPPLGFAAYRDFAEQAFGTLHGSYDGRLRFMLAPSAPQRCSADFYRGCYDMALERGVPFHTHVLETRVQAATGADLYGESLIAYMARLGVLSRNTTIAHSVWVTDADMALMGEAGVSVAHNVVSNLKLGSGVAPVRRLLDAGVTVALGTDGVSSNDTASVWDLMRVAGLVHAAPGPDPSQWLDAGHILCMATIDGAKSAMLENVTGSLEIGKAADLLLLDLASVSFTPLNDIARQLVYAENGRSLQLVMIDGRIVLENGRITTLDEPAVLGELRELLPAYLAHHAELEARNRVFEPYFAEIHRRAARRDLGMHRHIGDMPPFSGRNIGG
jgi:5-methylthioadenosine/S-adenosylhomocysteine deaminase